LSIGGLRKQKSEELLKKTPGLGDIPFVGVFFKKKVSETGGGVGGKGDTELFITLTPTIVTGKEAEPQKEKPEVKTQVIVQTPIVKEAGPPNPLMDYTNIIKKRIMDNLTYPTSAKEAGFQGTVRLNLHLSYRGEILDAVIKESSGYKILDDSALATAKGVASYPPFPPSIDEKKLWIEIPIAYNLD
jgi:protein TonB